MTRSASVAVLTSSLLLDQLLQQLTVVHDLVLAAELWILVLQRVEAVRALGDDLAHAHAVEHLDVGHGEHLEQVLVARPSRRVAGAHLAGTEDGEVEPGPLQELGHRAGDLPVLSSNDPTADPVKELVGEGLARIHDGHVEVAGQSARSPGSCPTGCPGSPWPGRRCRARPGSCSPWGEVPPHVEDLVEDLDVDRADLVAGLAGRAGPQLLGVSALEQEALEMVISRSRPMGGDTGPTGAVAAITSPTLRTISCGSSACRWRGPGTLVQRPHIVQASVSSNCFHVMSSTTLAPKVSRRSPRLGMGFAALRPILRPQVDVEGRRDHVPQHGDGQDQQERHEGHDVADPQRLVPALERLLGPAVDERRQRVADEAPLLELGRPSAAIRNISVV